MVFSVIERFHTPVYDEFHVTKESYVDASNYLGNLSDEDFLKLYDQSLRYELQDSQKEQYESSARIVKQYYENTQTLEFVRQFLNTIETLNVQR